MEISICSTSKHAVAHLYSNLMINTTALMHIAKMNGGARYRSIILNQKLVRTGLHRIPLAKRLGAPMVLSAHSLIPRT